MGVVYLYTETSADIYERGSMLAPFMFTPSMHAQKMKFSSFAHDSSFSPKISGTVRRTWNIGLWRMAAALAQRCPGPMHRRWNLCSLALSCSFCSKISACTYWFMSWCWFYDALLLPCVCMQYMLTWGPAQLGAIRCRWCVAVGLQQSFLPQETP
jgi:hypothetical protein